ncbi:AoPex11B [Diaporthe helianthi]|uniref:AoPex11B n=1 Tax=Diaporthe helianthi TaxID=158607 RepID=A0A2P5I9M0_DIAHE|nr:AoPex11B [Diaporthe helianthi]
MAPSTLEQFIRFGTDAAAIERMLRMAQSIVMVVISYPLLLDGFTQLVMLGNQHVWTDPRATGVVVLNGLKGHLALSRRFFRMFRFLESFYAAHQLYTSLYSPSPTPTPSAAAPLPKPAPTTSDTKDGAQQENHAAQPAQPPAIPQATTQQHHHPNNQHNRSKSGPPAEAWLDIFGRTFNGMYLLLETLCLVDAMQVPGFSLWGPAWASMLHVEGQRFWVFALGCGVASGLLKLVKLLAYAPVPPTGEGYGTGEKRDESEMADWERERERLRRIMWVRKKQRKLWKANIRDKSKGLVRRCVANLLDMAMPGSIVGWWKADQGTLGVILIVTTYLTGCEVWERCGREIARR